MACCFGNARWLCERSANHRGAGVHQSVGYHVHDGMRAQRNDRQFSSTQYTVNKQLIDVAYSLDVVEKGSGTRLEVVSSCRSRMERSRMGITAAAETDQHCGTLSSKFGTQSESLRLRCPESDGNPKSPQLHRGRTRVACSWLGRTADALRPGSGDADLDVLRDGFCHRAEWEFKPAFGLELPSGHQYGASLSIAGSRSVTHGILVARNRDQARR